MTEQLTHTVMVFKDRALTKHFSNLRAAAKYANQLLRQGRKDVKIYPYGQQAPKKSHIDFIVEEYEKTGRR